MAARSSFALQLAPEHTLGRRMQLALLSFAPGGARVSGDVALLDSVDDYLAAVESATLHVMDRLRLERPRSKCESGQLALNSLGSVDCCLYPGVPKLYRAGSGDFELLRGALSADKWVCAALSYADKVLSGGGPLGGSVSDLPWLAKASVFSSPRGPGGGAARRGRSQGYTLDTLGSVLLGGAAAFLGAYRMGDGQAEFYLLPEAVSEGYRSLLDALSLGGLSPSPHGNLAGAAVFLANNASVSLEAAVSAALAAKIDEAAGAARGLGLGEALGEAKLYLVRSEGRRPLVAEGLPLSAAHVDVLGGSAVRELLALASAAVRAGQEGGGALSAVATCINAALLDAANPCASTGLYSCLRDLDSLAKSPSLLLKRPQVGRAAARAAEAVHRRVLEVLSGCP